MVVYFYSVVGLGFGDNSILLSLNHVFNHDILHTTENIIRDGI